MQSMPIDTGRLGSLLCVVAPQARVNRVTGEVRKNRDGETLYAVGVSVRQLEGRRADVVDVVVAGEPKGLAEGVPVKIVDLTATNWEIEGRHGTSFRATAVVAESPPAQPAATTSSSSGGRGKPAGGEG